MHGSYPSSVDGEIRRRKSGRRKSGDRRDVFLEKRDSLKLLFFLAEKKLVQVRQTQWQNWTLHREMR
jgi:hypothetical protein